MKTTGGTKRKSSKKDAEKTTTSAPVVQLGISLLQNNVSFVHDPTGAILRSEGSTSTETTTTTDNAPYPNPEDYCDLQDSTAPQVIAFPPAPPPPAPIKLPEASQYATQDEYNLAIQQAFFSMEEKLNNTYMSFKNEHEKYFLLEAQFLNMSTQDFAKWKFEWKKQQLKISPEMDAELQSAYPGNKHQLRYRIFYKLVSSPLFPFIRWHQNSANFEVFAPRRVEEVLQTYFEERGYVGPIDNWLAKMRTFISKKGNPQIWKNSNERNFRPGLDISKVTMDPKNDRPDKSEKGEKGEQTEQLALADKEREQVRSSNLLTPILFETAPTILVGANNSNNNNNNNKSNSNKNNNNNHSNIVILSSISNNNNNNSNSKTITFVDETPPPTPPKKSNQQRQQEQKQQQQQPQVFLVPGVSQGTFFVQQPPPPPNQPYVAPFPTQNTDGRGDLDLLATISNEAASSTTTAITTTPSTTPQSQAEGNITIIHESPPLKNDTSTNTPTSTSPQQRNETEEQANKRIKAS
eukprot:TRINITY_DN1957_c0_g1_i1.p1 TRINITY_DN1957_c0_g1~~TRINITY_DN1957_c0_g1_i1.p1  ORF type:complete len:521 (+),score=138.83 TRINITY_DN1957_c0_g1_i1:317-1879(+)